MSSTPAPADVARHFYNASTIAISDAATSAGDPLCELRRRLGPRFGSLATAALAEVGPSLIDDVERSNSPLAAAVRVALERVETCLVLRLNDARTDAAVVSW